MLHVTSYSIKVSETTCRPQTFYQISGEVTEDFLHTKMSTFKKYLLEFKQTRELKRHMGTAITFSYRKKRTRLLCVVVKVHS